MDGVTKIIIEQPWTWVDTVNTISSIIMALCTVAVAVYAYRSWKVSKGIETYTSMAETHSEMLLKLEAKRNGIPIVWWDPTIEAPPVGWKHGKEIELEQIRFYIPKKLRKNKRKVPLKLGD
jgi:hypothetical protein